MQREWTDQRDDKAYRIEAEPRQSMQETGKPLEVMSEAPWRVWVHSDEAPNLAVAPDVGPRLPELSDRDLQRMLDKVRGVGDGGRGRRTGHLLRPSRRPANGDLARLRTHQEAASPAGR